MQTTRQQKIARLIQKELSDIFQRQTQATHGLLVSVSRVRVSPDLSIAKAYLSVFPSEKAEEIIKSLTAHQGEVRYELGKRTRHQLRIIPELAFYPDDSLDYLDHIDDLLGINHKAGEEGNETAPTAEGEDLGEGKSTGIVNRFLKPNDGDTTSAETSQS